MSRLNVYLNNNRNRFFFLSKSRGGGQNAPVTITIIIESGKIKIFSIHVI